MKIFQTIGQIRKFRSDMTGSLGLVPTMGFLHEGHLSLVRQAKAENDSTAVSIFVNPTQFAPTEDFKEYPRDMHQDIELLRQERVDLVFNPEPEEIYPEAFQSSIDTGAVSEPLEGACRPGHFLGVSTIVAKLFNIVLPNRAYFGQKDGQQVLVIKRMTKDLDYPVEVVVAPTVREVDGLAMSSRNVYLSGPERKAAASLSRGLFSAQSAWEAGEQNSDSLRNRVRQTLEEEPLASLEYVSLADENLTEIEGTLSTSAMLSLAARIGQTRLIDNVILQKACQE